MYMKIIDNFLNSTTMYRLILYYLIALALIGLILSFFKLVPFDFLSMLVSAAIFIGVGWVSNSIFAKVFKVSTNCESIFISSLIALLIFTPSLELRQIGLFAAVAVVFSSSKFILNFKRKHLFNPVAVSAVVVALTGIGSASWWVGTGVMALPVLIGGLLIVKKIKRFDLVISFLLVALIVILINGFLKGTDLLTLARQVLIDSPILFFSFVMLTEPLSTPPTKKLKIIYGVLIGFLFNPNLHLGGIYSTPEIALVLGNIFSFVVSPKERLVLKLSEKNQIGKDIYDFIFTGAKLKFKPGQYLEWTLGYPGPDSRGNRRYFTIASSPTEDNFRLGVKFYPNSSGFKRSLLNLKVGGELSASNLDGEFTLPENKNTKLCFIAGGIGVTPYRSIIKYLVDNGEKRDIILLYSCNTKEEVVYKDVFDKAEGDLGIRVRYLITEEYGFLDEAKIKKEVPDFEDRTFYISGPPSMVNSFQKILKSIKVSKIITDFFPGYS